MKTVDINIAEMRKPLVKQFGRDFITRIESAARMLALQDPKRVVTEDNIDELVMDLFRKLVNEDLVFYACIIMYQKGVKFTSLEG